MKKTSKFLMTLALMISVASFINACGKKECCKHDAAGTMMEEKAHSEMAEETTLAESATDVKNAATDVKDSTVNAVNEVKHH